MGRMAKYSIYLVVVLAMFSQLMVTTVYAQSIPKPSAPEFTVKYVDNSYDLPPTYGIDEYTGQNVTKDQGTM